MPMIRSLGFFRGTSTPMLTSQKDWRRRVASHSLATTNSMEAAKVGALLARMEEATPCRESAFTWTHTQHQLLGNQRGEPPRARRTDEKCHLCKA
jgi:hypothetical protein